MKFEMIQRTFSRKMLVALVMGFASGLPLLMTGSLLQAWLKDSGVELSKIGLVSLLGLPYSLKFVWAPFVDRYSIPLFGRRRGWLIIFQVLLMLTIFWLAGGDPINAPVLLGIIAFLTAFFSASQDIVIDAYRREDLCDEELGLGSSSYIFGYRMAMLLVGGGGMILADYFTFGSVYILLGICLIPAILTTIFTPEPKIDYKLPVSLKETVIEPLLEFFKRREVVWLLAFIVLYKIGDIMAAAMTTPFYMEIGFTKTQIGAVVKLVGMWALIVGGITGGIMMLKLGINKSLWIFGVLQAISTLGFGILTFTGVDTLALAGVIAFENFTGGMGTAAYAAFMASLTNKKFTATQYALLSSLMSVPRIFAAAPTGYLAQYTGWWNFFVFCTLAAIPGMLILLIVAPFKGNHEVAKVVEINP